MEGPAVKITHALGQVADRHWFILPASLLLAAVIVWGVSLLRAPPIDVLDSSITQEVKPGGYVSVMRTVRWLRKDCRSFTSQAAFWDDLKPPREHPMPLQYFGDLSHRQHFDTEWQVSFTQPWGKTTFVNRLQFACFPFYEMWPITVEMPAVGFHVGPP